MGNRGPHPGYHRGEKAWRRNSIRADGRLAANETWGAPATHRAFLVDEKTPSPSARGIILDPFFVPLTPMPSVFSSVLFFLLQFNGNHLRNTRLFHRYSVKRIV